MQMDWTNSMVTGKHLAVRRLSDGKGFFSVNEPKLQACFVDRSTFVLRMDINLNPLFSLWKGSSFSYALFLLTSFSTSECLHFCLVLGNNFFVCDILNEFLDFKLFSFVGILKLF